MCFPTKILIFQWIGIVLIPLSETAITGPPNPLKVKVGEALNFTWTSDVPTILLAVWGVGSGVAPSPQYIYVDSSENPTINSAGLDDYLERRLKYIGNLAQGRAWFVIYNATVNDTNTYVARIREDRSSTTAYHVNVIVEPATVTPATVTSTTSPATPPPSISSTTSSSTSPPIATSTPKPSPPPPTPEGLSDGEIAAIVIGAIIGLVIGMISGWLIYKYCKKKHRPDNHPADKKTDTELKSPSA